MASATRMASSRPNELLARFDLNHDGKLDDDEKAAAKLAYLDDANAGERRVVKAAKAHAKRFDTDGDGRLNASERAALEKSLRADLESHPKRLKRADTDHDGKLSDAEWQAVREAIRMRAKDGAAMAAKEMP